MNPVILKRGSYGLNIGQRWDILPAFERWENGDWMLTFWRVCAWRDTTEPVTVGERGVW